MGLTSLQVCMDSSDWLQGTMHEETGMDSSSPSGGDMLTCSRPLMERRLRPPHDQALKCPRCDSTHTKFCYYNNYSLSQPRYFCKTCRRYWTKGGTLRNIPVGGGCRKNKKVSSKKSSSNDQNTPGSSTSHNPTDLQLSFPEGQFCHLTNLLGNHNPTFMEAKYENPSLVGGFRNYDFMGNGGELGMVGGLGDVGTHGLGLGPNYNFHGLCAPFGMSIDGSTGSLMDTCQRLTFPYEGNEDHTGMDVKPNTKMLALEWQDQGFSDSGKESFGYNQLSGLGYGLMNGYGSSAMN